MKKLLAILLGTCLLLGVMSGCGGDAEDAVTVQKVSDITSQGSVGLVNRYAGLVVSGETATVKKGDKKVLETYVQEGDFVTEGDVLFSSASSCLSSRAMRTRFPTPRRTSPISNVSATPPLRRSSSPTRSRFRSCRRTCVRRPITRVLRNARSRICRRLSKIRTSAPRSPAA